MYWTLITLRAKEILIILSTCIGHFNNPESKGNTYYIKYMYWTLIIRNDMQIEQDYMAMPNFYN